MQYLNKIRTLDKEKIGRVLIFLFVLLIIIHFLLLLGIIPVDNVWGGNLNEDNWIAAELASLLFVLLMIGVVAVRSEIIKAKSFMRFAKIGTWLIFLYMILNTLGNIYAQTTLEKVIFTPISLLMAILAFLLAISKDEMSDDSDEEIEDDKSSQS